MYQSVNNVALNSHIYEYATNSETFFMVRSYLAINTCSIRKPENS